MKKSHQSNKILGVLIYKISETIFLNKQGKKSDKWTGEKEN